MGIVSIGIAVVLVATLLASLTSSASPGVAQFQVFTTVTALGSVGSFALGVLLFFLMGRSFAALDDPEFRTPYTCTWVGIGGAVLGVVGGLLLVSAVSSLFSGSPDIGALAAADGVLLLGGIVSLIGAIGMLVGIWRLGEWFGSGALKAAAILMIFASPIAFAVMLWASVSLRRTLARRAPI